MLASVRAQRPALLERIRETGALDDETEKKLVAALDAFGKVFHATRSEAA
jgi:F0F1-type ATP synthase alpha subunit